MSSAVQIAGRPLTVRLARFALWFILVLSAFVTVATIVGGLVGLAAGTTVVTLVADKPLPPGVSGATVHIVHGGYDTATVTLSHASAAIATLSVLSSVGQILAHAALAGAVGLVAWRVLRPGLFRRSLSVQFTVMGVLVFAGGLLWQFCAMVASGLAAVALNAPRQHGFWPLAGRLDPTYVIVGFAFVVVGLIFEYGGRLQKETEGLV
jgi:hypothetical protein